MGIVTSMFVIAVGAITGFAVTMQGNGFNVHATGVVLMIDGGIGAVLSIGFWASWGGFGHLLCPGSPVLIVASVSEREVVRAPRLVSCIIS